jgi:hypothetical protein
MTLSSRWAVKQAAWSLESWISRVLPKAGKFPRDPRECKSSGGELLEGQRSDELFDMSVSSWCLSQATTSLPLILVVVV